MDSLELRNPDAIRSYVEKIMSETGSRTIPLHLLNEVETELLRQDDAKKLEERILSGDPNPTEGLYTLEVEYTDELL